MKKIVKRWLGYIYRKFVVISAASYQKPLKVQGLSFVSKNTFLGKNVSFNGIRISGCGVVQIGDNFHSGKDCLLISQNHNYKGNKIPYDDTYICKDIIIKDNVWLGDRVIVLPGVVIGEGAIIQAGSVVVNNIPDYAIVGGNPAKIFASRDIVHYETLKKQKLFH